MVFAYRDPCVFNNIDIGTDIVNKTECTEFLKVQLGSSLNFSEQVSTMCNKIARSIGVIYKVSNTFPLDILNRLYRTIVLPHFSLL